MRSRAIAILMGLFAATYGSPLSSQEITVDSVLLTISQQAEISARETGVLSELMVREGQLVKAGYVVARLDDSDAKLAYDRALIDLDRVQQLAANTIKVRLAKKELEIAQVELKRATDSSERLKKSVTQAELDRLKLDVDRALLQLEQTEFDLETARLVVRVQENELQSAMERLRRRQLISPISGTVVTVQRHLGESLDAGQVVARVIAVDRLRAECFLNVEQVTADLMGRKVQFTVRRAGLESKRFPGTLTFVHPEVDPVNGQIRVWAEIENSEANLRPGLSGSLKISP